MKIDSLKIFAGRHFWIFIITWVLMFITLVILMWKRKKYPLNIFLLTLFTLLMAIAVGLIVSYYDSRVVLQAFTVTACTFVALTIFTVQSRIKFDGLGPFLFGATWVLIFVGIVQLFLPFYFWTHILITIASGMIFTLYIIYDTYQIWNRLSPEEYVVGAVELYLDVINVFLSVLTLFGLGSE
ncbi:inhibitor of apoptosis-promoting Bax1-domain-containing protein [Jimgerdemannia flammicorona]|uniref:Inhibitor of apoptosis-promoting Bax1-domain-containing protein n=1 Tax=Jimgerdemannia flammicorona TaxID=994334 RepID=A0A433QN58_9FUNG|nr:inhibitor of apoptosis-promoting Bax1-domain-containing protein [Jimgerdemannia flammicorona]